VRGLIFYGMADGLLVLPMPDVWDYAGWETIYPLRGQRYPLFLVHSLRFARPLRVDLSVLTTTQKIEIDTEQE
jgi:hypothetical protein